MLPAVVHFSLTQRLFVAVLALAVTGLGLRAWLQLPIDAFPDIAPTQVKIVLKAPGMTAEEIERRVTYPIETELLGIPRQAMLRSTTKYAIASITLDFVEGTDIYWARQQVGERLARVRDRLPATVEGGVAAMSTPLSEMFMFTLENPDLNLTEKRQLLDWEIRPVLRTVTGVADVNSLGGYVRSYQVTPDSNRLAQLGLGLEDLRRAITNNNRNVGAGRIVQGNDVLVVRTGGRLRNGRDLAALPVPAPDGAVYRLEDLTDIDIGHLARYGAVTRDGAETAQALVIALKDANTGAVVEGVKAKLAELERSLPPGTELNVFYDRARLIDTAIGTITSALVQAVLLVIGLLALFLGNLRAALVVSLSLPLAALATFLLMDLTGLTANLMSLGGLVIAIGMIVDASVVVVENAVTRLAEDAPLPRLHVIYRATREVATPVVSGTLIVLIVFSPLLTLTGLEGKLFAPVALTIVFAMLAALALALTLVPILASLLLTADAARVPRFVLRLQAGYTATLRRVLRRPWPLAAALTVLLVISAILAAIMGKTFMPVMDEGDIIVQLKKSPSISLEASVALDKQVEKALLAQVPELRQIVARTGSDELGLDPMGLNETDVFMELAPREAWSVPDKAAIEDAIRAALERFPGINTTFTQPIQMRVSEMLTGSSGDVAIKIFGDDLATLADLVERSAAVAREVEGAVDVKATVTEGGKFIAVRVRGEVAARHGLDTEALADRLRAQLEGLKVSEIMEGRRRTPVLFAAAADALGRPASPTALARQPVVLPDGSVAPLSAVASVSYEEGPLRIEREQGRRFGAITLNVSGRDVVGFVDDLRARLAAQAPLPPGYSVAFGGEFENQQRAMRNLLLVIPVALALILIILFTTFRSLVRAGLILGNVPFALMGGIMALFASGEYLSVPASVGLIALLGVAILNGVVMLSYFEQLRSAALDLEERILRGARQRLRPILMTATTAMFGLLPLVFASGPGTEIQRPLAIVVIGGLLTSTLTTLYLLPVFYQFAEGKRHD
ncbi:efflux RND transporter permease subunit [Pseudohaliea rubra]|uniref:Cobalt-zinc-cadmium resistance protein CzcA, Cation efflux system protein CusA n=1 Tax=Pseudohaliea rubra DSM 19751 TaxID=1265313 RepID=A0A095XSY2_9GAMM|nr:efflux RND transporter permease subunit [Pseudohaliea rubra]KGE02776.1 Cobalt-zinc-cadmium resistance protein CzcA, Cation efflux system protein CusA [Pseudohaliea rubra DSM 19751]